MYLQFVTLSTIQFPHRHSSLCTSASYEVFWHQCGSTVADHASHHQRRVVSGGAAAGTDGACAWPLQKTSVVGDVIGRMGIVAQTKDPSVVDIAGIVLGLTVLISAEIKDLSCRQERRENLRVSDNDVPWHGSPPHQEFAKARTAKGTGLVVSNGNAGGSNKHPCFDNRKYPAI